MSAQPGPLPRRAGRGGVGQPLHGLSVLEAAALIRRRKLSPVELVEALLARIEALEPTIQAWEWVDAQGALAAARQREAELRRSERLGPLHGVPLGFKDLYHVAGLPTRAGFRPFATHVARQDAAAVARLRAAGAIVLGKTVTTQFAFADPARTRNPWNTARTPGGSSSGSAAAVAARMVPAALGTQTAGSVLRPAAYCGVVGLKPTFGRVSRRGILPLAWSLDHVGLLARRVDDTALLLRVLAGHDPEDPDSADVPVDDYLASASPSLSLLLVEDFLERAPARTQQHVREVARLLELAGARVESVRLPHSLDLLLAVQYLLMQVEGAAVHAELLARYPDEYAPVLRAFVEVGQLVPGVAYVQARQLQRWLRTEMVEVRERWRAAETERSSQRPCCLLTPTATDVAPDLSTTGDRTFQAPWSLLGLPALSLPSGLSPEGLPLAIQLAAAPFQEAQLLAAARWCEAVLGPLPAPE